ncbi:hypothetical protein [Labrys wisconsinensis]|uniref:Antibiotic biosynthesis monooxygenase (ABM) superfamily enzyme n=1 Tax=Labrys wisconsinensis TaxID=425677 RepID=A0ABU0J0R5_9HYPH|nr:hypothetical protein [Labrys wisconsinensis]MDQ0467858.1 antibiotic biosynthesis monooxygenase (ABM) superfamily enzyme [Labrys wisconsinensis]
MFIRCAFFRGRVKPGCEDAFTAFVRERLVPLWTRFPGAEEVRVLRQEEADVAEPRLEMVLAIRYPSRAAIEAALASDVRAQSRVVTGELMAMFEGDIFHTVFRAEDFPLPTG